jgi:type I restriction enzyme S subunit
VSEQPTHKAAEISVSDRVANQIEEVRAFLLARYPGDFHRRVKIRDFLQSVCEQHFKLGLGDPNLSVELCSGDEARYWQRLSEILLGNEILALGLPLRASRNGPDFLLELDGLRVWIEVICPQATGIPEDWLFGDAVAVPHEAQLLRWTSAIKEKGEKLLGNAAGAKGYLEKGVVGPLDAYVIAINGRLLRGRHFATITGISQFPCAVEAAFAVGPITIVINLETGKQAGSGYQHRPVIRKPNGAQVPAYTFLDPAFSAVSAIWATDIDESWVIGNMKPMAVVHNPGARNPIPTGLLPAQDEYVATANGPDDYLLETRKGRLAK